jgi:hypothetical protein
VSQAGNGSSHIVEPEKRTSVFMGMTMPEPIMSEQRRKADDRRHRNPHDQRQRQLGDERRRDVFPGKAQYQ